MLAETIIFLAGGVSGFLLDKTLEYLSDNLLQKIKIKRRRKIAQKRADEQMRDLNIHTLAHFIPPISQTADENLINITLFREDFFLSPPMAIYEKLPNKNTFQKKDILPLAFEKTIEKYNISEKVIEESKFEAAYSFLHQQDGNYFNGGKYGVRTHNFFERTSQTENVICNYQLYKTDYYTHVVMEKIREKTPAINSPLQLSNLNADLSIFRTSIGLSILVYLTGTNEIILTKRSKDAAYTGSSYLWYVSVTEAINDMDYNQQNGKIDLFQAVYRGMEEELGIPSKDVAEITLNEAFFENNFFQDNLTATVYLKSEVTLSDIVKRSARDKTLEVSDIISIPAEEKAINEWLQRNEQNCQYQTIYTLEKFIETHK